MMANPNRCPARSIYILLKVYFSYLEEQVFPTILILQILNKALRVFSPSKLRQVSSLCYIVVLCYAVHFMC